MFPLSYTVSTGVGPPQWQPLLPAPAPRSLRRDFLSVGASPSPGSAPVSTTHGFYASLIDLGRAAVSATLTPLVGEHGLFPQISLPSKSSRAVLRFSPKVCYTPFFRFILQDLFVMFGCYCKELSLKKFSSCCCDMEKNDSGYYFSIYLAYLMH